jgi:glycosyltransferase involved in cell wall biosynthesis
LKKTILIIQGSLEIGGTEIHMSRILPHLVQSGWIITIFLISCRGPLANGLEQDGIKLIGPGAKLYTPSSNFILRGIKIIQTFIVLTIYLIKNRPSIVHSFLPEAYVVGGLCAWWTCSKRFIMSRRSLNYYQKSHTILHQFELLLHSRTSYFLANSKAVELDLQNEGADLDKIQCIYNAINVKDVETKLKKYNKSDVRKKYNLSDNSLVLIKVANLISYKGHVDLLNVLATIGDDLPNDWCLLCAGRDDGLLPRLKAIAEENQISHHIRWLGEVDDIFELLAASDIGLLCSHEEGFPNVILEYMSAGLPVIASNAGGIPEIITHDESGKIFTVHNLHQLASFVIELCNDRDQRIELGHAGKEQVASIFTEEKCVREYLQMYERLLEEKASK